MTAVTQRIEGQTHRFEWKPDGKLHHTVEEELRAVIEPGNVDKYRETFPGAPERERSAAKAADESEDHAHKAKK